MYKMWCKCNWNVVIFRYKDLRFESAQLFIPYPFNLTNKFLFSSLYSPSLSLSLLLSLSFIFLALYLHDHFSHTTCNPPLTPSFLFSLFSFLFSLFSFLFSLFSFHLSQTTFSKKETALPHAEVTVVSLRLLGIYRPASHVVNTARPVTVRKAALPAIRITLPT